MIAFGNFEPNNFPGFTIDFFRYSNWSVSGGFQKVSQVVQGVSEGFCRHFRGFRRVFNMFEERYTGFSRSFRVFWSVTANFRDVMGGFGGLLVDYIGYFRMVS